MNSVLILVPVKPQMNRILQLRLRANLRLIEQYNPSLRMSVCIAEEPEPKLAGDATPWSRVTRVRNRMLAKVPWREHDYVMWLDADLVEFPPDLPTRLVNLANQHGR